MLTQLNISDGVLFKGLISSFISRMPDPDDSIDPDGPGDPLPDDDSTNDPGSEPPPGGS